MNLSEVEKALLPIACPLLLQLWANTILPAIQDADSKIGSPELKIIGDAGVAALDQIVKAEIAKLQSV